MVLTFYTKIHLFNSKFLIVSHYKYIANRTRGQIQKNPAAVKLSTDFAVQMQTQTQNIGVWYTNFVECYWQSLSRQQIIVELVEKVDIVSQAWRQLLTTAKHDGQSVKQRAHCSSQFMVKL